MGMSRVRFRLAVEELGMGELWTVTPVVDGVSLVELARRQELAPAKAAREEDMAGAYAGLAIGRGRSDAWRAWFLGGGMSFFGDGDTCLLGCRCGDVRCWPLTAHVELTKATVTWRDFRTGHRAWDLSRLGPFVFARNAYERALADPEVS